MNFLLDHDVPSAVGRALERAGHAVTVVEQILPRTAPDRDVFDAARRHGLILVTCNRDDFIEFAGEWPHPGIVALIRRNSRAAECAHLLALLNQAEPQGLANNFNFA